MKKPFSDLKGSEEGKKPTQLSKPPPTPKPCLEANKAKFKALGSWREPASLKDTPLAYPRSSCNLAQLYSAPPVGMESLCSSFCDSNSLLGLVSVSIYYNSARGSRWELFEAVASMAGAGLEGWWCWEGRARLALSEVCTGQ